MACMEWDLTELLKLCTILMPTIVFTVEIKRTMQILHFIYLLLPERCYTPWVDHTLWNRFDKQSKCQTWEWKQTLPSFNVCINLGISLKRPPTCVLPDRHNNPLPDRHNNPIPDRHSNPLPDQHNNPLPDRHNPLPERHNNPLPDRHNNPLITTLWRVKLLTLVHS